MAAVEVLEDRAVRLLRDPVEATNLVVRAPRALRDLQTVLLENCLVGEAFLHRGHGLSSFERVARV